jgi:hypothetical protein
MLKRVGALQSSIWILIYLSSVFLGKKGRFIEGLILMEAIK